MKIPLPLVLVCLLPAAAEDLTTTDGKTYKSVTIRKVEPDGLAITHETGLAKVPFTKLSKEIQEKHGYDPKKGEAHAKEVEGEQMAFDRAVEEEFRRRIDAVPWHKRFSIEPDQDNLTWLTYRSFGEAAGEVRELLERERRSPAEIEARLAKVPRGGILIVRVERLTIDAANAKYFSVVITGPGDKVLVRAQGESDVAEAPIGDGLWWNHIAVPLEAPLRAGDQIRVVDQLANSQADFTVIPEK